MVAPKDGIHRKHFFETKAGNTFIVQRKPGQTFERFKSQCQVLASSYKIDHGILTTREQHESHCVFTVVRDRTNPLPEAERRVFNNPRRKKHPERQGGPVTTVYEAPAKPPAPEPPKPVAEMREDESRFWCELFTASLSSAPSADPTRHVNAARVGVEAYRGRFAPQ